MKRIGIALLVATLFLVGRDATIPAPVADAAPFGLTVVRNCTSTFIPIGGTVTCTTVITTTILPSFPEPVTVIVSPGAVGAGANGQYGRARLIAPTNAVGDVNNVVLTNPADGTTQSLVIECNGPNCTFFFPGDQMVITETLTGLVGGPLTETIQFTNDPPETLLPALYVAPANVGATLVCAPNAFPANSGVTQVSTCTATFSDNDIFPTTVSSANVIVSLSGPTGTVITSTGTQSATLRCGTLLNAPQNCSTIQFQVQSNSALAGNVAMQLNYIPDVAAVDGQFSQNFVDRIIVGNALAQPLPNTAASLVVSGPASIACGALGTITATMRDAGGNVVAAPTQVAFNTSIGTIASPQTTAAGVASTALGAPATGNGGNALITAISGGLTSQTVVPLTACTTLPITTTTNNTTTNNTTNTTTQQLPAGIQQYLQPFIPYMQPPIIQQQPAAPQQPPIINVTINIPKEAFPQLQGGSGQGASSSGQSLGVSQASGPGGSFFKPPNTGDGGLAGLIPPSPFANGEGAQP